MGLTEEVQPDFFRALVGSAALSLLTQVGNILTEQGAQGYVVGGFVRDVLVGRGTADIDFAVDCDAPTLATRVAGALEGKYVLLDKANRVGRVVLAGKGAPSPGGQWELDFSTFKGSIEQDLARRDFTVNAMAFDLGQLGKGPGGVELLDPFGGWNDLEQGLIRTVAETAFESDPARLLRAVRLAGELGYCIDSKTEALVRRYSPLIASVAGERVREELLRLLGLGESGQFLPYLDRLGLLTAMVPELSAARGVGQPREHFWDVFEHSLRTVAGVDFLLRHGAWDYGSQEVLDAVPWSAVLAEHFDQEVSSGSTRRVLLKLAALLHDVAKPQTKATDPSGRTRFLGHSKDGAAMAVSVLERLRFSAKEVRYVETVVRHHLRPMQMGQDGLPSRRAIYRYFRDTGDTGIDILFLSLADHLASRGPDLDLPRWQEHAATVEYVLSRYFEQESEARPAKLIDGHDLINIFGMGPGPEIGELLEAVQEAQASGELNTREDALAYIREHLLTRGD